VGQHDPVQIFEHPGGYGAAFNHDESRVLTWGQDGKARLWAVSQHDPILALDHNGGVTGAVFSHDGDRILTWSGDGLVRLWDVSLDDSVSLEERILEFQIRSDTNLSASGELRLLSPTEWTGRKRELEMMRAKRISSK
jgi:WD40 repeat protein